MKENLNLYEAAVHCLVKEALHHVSAVCAGMHRNGSFEHGVDTLRARQLRAVEDSARFAGGMFAKQCPPGGSDPSRAMFAEIVDKLAELAERPTKRTAEQLTRMVVKFCARTGFESSQLTTLRLINARF